MSLFDGLDIQDCKPTEDKIGGGSYAKFDTTGSYDVIIKMAYATVAESGAIGVVTTFEREDGAKLTNTEWVTNKVKQTYYIDSKTGEKKYLAGYNAIMSLDRIVTKKDRKMPTTEKKSIKLWDRTAGKEVPQEKEVITDWLNKPVTIMIHKVLKNKSAKDDTGKYVDTPEEVETIAIQHYVDAITKKTKNEIISGAEATIYTKWNDKFKSDYVSDKRTIKDGASTATIQNDGSIKEDNPFTIGD